MGCPSPDTIGVRSCFTRSSGVSPTATITASCFSWPSVLERHPDDAALDLGRDLEAVVPWR